MKESLYQTADAGESPSDSGCRTQMSLYQTADPERQEYLDQTTDEGVSLSDSGCRRISIRQWMQDTLY